MALSTTEALDNFVSEYVTPDNLERHRVAYDSQWPSICYDLKDVENAESENIKDGTLVLWAPKKQNVSLSFDNVSKAMGIELNEAFCDYFTRYFSNNLSARAPQGRCELLQVWNESDFERLQQNLIGHLLMKQRLNQRPTLFFGITDEDDFILSVINETGEVALEQVGKEPTKILASSLPEFLTQLSI
tara:strand:+ start:2936 stop:3499 length:564 start_codon:yes stop_codon:yes gene_type:complete